MLKDVKLIICKYLRATNKSYIGINEITIQFNSTVCGNHGNYLIYYM